MPGMSKYSKDNFVFIREFYGIPLSVLKNIGIFFVFERIIDKDNLNVIPL
jgi:hypothetical protein